MTTAAKREGVGEVSGQEAERDSGVAAVGEVLWVFGAFLLFIKYLETTWFGVAQLNLVGWDFFAHLMMMAFPLAVTFMGQRRLADLGITRAQFFDSEVRRISRIAVAELALIWLAFALVPHLFKGQRPMLLLPPYHFGVMLGLPLLESNLLGRLITVIFTVVFCGLGEEVLFRGYIQGRLNRALGRPFRLLGVDFGWGLVIASALFGLGHGFAFFNPFVGNILVFRPDFLAAAVTGVEGFILGLIFERTRGILAPAIVHGAIGLFFSAIVF
jgi:hypothetical protein